MSDDDEFFVGYLPVPPRTRRSNRLAAAVALLLAIVAATIAALSMATPGSGVFGSGERFTGVLHTQPYALVDVADSHVVGGVAAILLVRPAKFGLGHSADALDGRVVTVQGNLMQRGGHRMLELGAAPRAATLDAATEARLRAVRDEPLGDVTLDGEIVDSKCWLGRMKPGGGRTHRACAQLCLMGGIPPVLVTRDEAGQETDTLLVTRDDRPIHARLLAFAAEPVRVRGALYRHADLLVLRTDASLVERR